MSCAGSTANRLTADKLCRRSDGCLVVVFSSSQIKVIATRGEDLGVQQAVCQVSRAANACALHADAGKLALASGHEVCRLWLF
jgi:hypothetical protein